jgi:outer membrane biosynthesis protein TonB
VLAVAGVVGFLMRGKTPPAPPPVVVQTPPPTKVETPPPTKVETPPPTKVETPPPTKVETPTPDEHEKTTKVTKTPSTPSASNGYGYLDFDTRPYTSVFIGHKKLGDTPLLQTKVPAGKLTLTLINDDAGIHESYQITIPKDGHIVKKLKL